MTVTGNVADLVHAVSHDEETRIAATVTCSAGTELRDVLGDDGIARRRTCPRGVVLCVIQEDLGGVKSGQ